MTKDEFEIWRTQFATSKSDIMGLRYAPFCFTEQGVTMLSCILSSKRAIEVNIRVVRLFIKMREMFNANKEILRKLADLEHTYTDHEREIRIIFDYLKQLEREKQLDLEFKTRRKIGFKSENDK
jgi:ORF6N domain